MLSHHGMLSVPSVTLPTATATEFSCRGTSTDRPTHSIGKAYFGCNLPGKLLEMVLNPEPILIPANVTCFIARVAAPASSNFSTWVRKFTVKWQQ